MSRTKYMTYMAMLLTLTIVLSIFESALPSFTAVPGVKPGLANIVVMFTVFFIGKRYAIILNIAKSLFVLITRGAVAGILSLCGGMLSILVIILLLHIFKDRISYVLLSIGGAISHNIGQIIAVSFMLNGYAYMYLPVLIVSGVVMGSVTGTLLKVLMPVLSYPLKEAGK